jgi:hypothetical protein
MVVSAEKTADLALACLIGKLKGKLGTHSKYAEIIASCSDIKLTSAGKFSASIGAKGCITKLAQEGASAAGAATATAISKTLGGWASAVKCGNIAVNIVAGALTSWTAEINTHWRPGETNLDGLPVNTAPNLTQWRKDSCNFGGNIPDRDWWRKQSGASSCKSGCSTYAEGSYFTFESTKVKRRTCLSKCNHICTKCCRGSSCSKPHLGGRNSYGVGGLCKWY